MQHTQFDQVPPLFILGIARSGTTLLQSLLDGHPQLLVDVADSHFFEWYRYTYRWIYGWSRRSVSLEEKLAMAEKFMVSRIFHEASPYYQSFLSSIPISELKSHFHSLVLGSKGEPKDFLEAYFHALGLASRHLREQTCFWVDKTLGYEYMFYRYTQWWPNARFIFVVRDPRDIYSSYKKRDLKNDRPVTSIESFAVTWGNSVRALEDCRQMVAPENHYIIHYEDLVHNPEETMGGIAKFLGIEMLPGLLEPTKGFGRVPWGGNPESGIRRTGVIYQDATQKWRRDLEADEIARLEGLLSKEMELAGYWPSDPPKKYPLSAANVYLRINLFRFLNLGL